MTETIFLYGLVLIVIGWIFVFLSILINSTISKELKRKNDIKELEVKNELNRIYMDIDLIKTKEMIDGKIKEYIAKWVLINITSKGDNYIKDQEVEELINDTTSKFILEMSDIHLFYIKCLTTITNDDELVRFVREETKFLVLEYIVDFNKVE